MSYNPNDFLKIFLEKAFYVTVVSLSLGIIGGYVFAIEWIPGYPSQSFYINIAFWFINSFLLLSAIYHSCKKIREVVIKKDKFKKLDRKSREILNFYLDENFPVACLDDNNGIVSKMEKEGLIYKSGKKPNAEGKYDYNINSDVFEWFFENKAQQDRTIITTTQLW